jgi:hypothetical protein
MNALRSVGLVAALSALAVSCGSSPSGTIYTVSPGSYAVTNQSAWSLNACNLTTESDGPLTVTDPNDSLTIKFPAEANLPSPAGYQYSVTHDDNQLDTISAYDIVRSNTCTEHIVYSITANVTANNTFTGSFVYNSSTAAGGDCSTYVSPYPIPCASSRTFTGTLSQ